MSTQTPAKQDGFKSKWGFIMACIGSAVGMANIWRFPYMVASYGGLTFLLPYFLFVVLVGASGVMEEFALGRWFGAGPVGSFGGAVEHRPLHGGYHQRQQGCLLWRQYARPCP